MKFCLAVSVLLCLEATALAQDSKIPNGDAPSVKTESSRTGTQTYDATREAVADIQRAIAEARKTGKRLLLDVGGDWCPWCRSLDQLFEGHPELVRLRDQNFIIVPVYYNANNKNEPALSKYSKVLGIPHFFVLETNGTMLHSQHMVELQADGTYSPEKVKDFLTKWSPPPKDPPAADSNLTAPFGQGELAAHVIGP